MKSNTWTRELNRIFWQPIAVLDYLKNSKDNVNENRKYTKIKAGMIVSKREHDKEIIP